MLEKIDALKLNKRLLWIIFAIVFILGFVITYFSLKILKISNKDEHATKASEYSLVTPEPVNTEKGIYNILLLGYGGSGHSGGGLTDSIIVLRVDTNAKKYTLISIPRDLWSLNNRKINSEASVNGFQNVGPAIQGVTGLSTENYISVDFGNYSKIIDDLGGIEIDVPKTFTDSFYPIKGMENETCGYTEDQINTFKTKYLGFELEKQFTCRYETVAYQKGPATLDGTAALKFVRSRHGDSDFGRSERQFAVLRGILRKLISFKSLNKLDETIATLFDMVKTDLTLGKIKTLVEIFGDPGSYQATEIHLSTENVLKEGKSNDGQYILYPKAGISNFSEVKSFINSNIGN